SDTLPSFATEIAEVLSPTNPLGIKAGGEGGTTAAPAVVISAVVDALRDYGVRHIDMPATPYAIRKAIRDAKTGRSRPGPACTTPAGTDAMTTETTDVQRILQFKFRWPNADVSQLTALLKSATPFYQASGTRARLLRNVDDPNQFIQVLEYKVPEMIEMNRQAIASDP